MRAMRMSRHAFCAGYSIMYPYPPMIWRASSVTWKATRVPMSLAMEISFTGYSPLS